MPWVEETLRHDRFLDDLFYKVFRRFQDPSGNYWWQDFNAKVPKVDLYKITFEKGVLVKGTDGHKLPDTPVEGHVCVTRHMIMRRWDNEFLGFAQSTGAFKIDTKNLPKDKTELLAWFADAYKDFVDYTTVYAYTLDKYEGYTHYEGKSETGASVEPVTIMVDDNGFGVLQASLDIEFHSEDEYHEEMKQSPIVTMNLKGDTGEQVAAIGKLNFKTNTNWWDDSLIQLRGVFDETSAFFTLKVDSAPTWEDNMVTLVPFFFGNLVQGNATQSNETPIAMLGGRQVDKFFDFDNVDLKTDILQPVTRNYVHHPSNGVDSIMVKKTKYGARYQEHFLSWNVPPNLMPPTREELRLASGDLKEVVPKRRSTTAILTPANETTITLTQNDPYVREAKFYEGCRYLVFNDEEIAVIQSIDVENNTLTLVRKEGKVWSAGTTVKGYTSESVESVKRKYPRAWNYLRFGYYQYDFHPSRYSDKIHTSRALVVHPEDGTVGYIPNIVLLPVINVMEGDKLKFPHWCAECVEPAYIPASPEDTPVVEWNPKPAQPTAAQTPNTDVGGAETVAPNRFSHHCDNSIAANTIDDSYWKPSTITQDYLTNHADGIGRPLSEQFWEGRNDWIDYLYEPDSKYQLVNSKLQVGDFQKFLWKSLEDVKHGVAIVSESWLEFKAWADSNLTCLTDLQKASLFMTAKLEKPVMFFPSSEEFLNGNILDEMTPLLRKVPNVVYDWVDFNNVYEESSTDRGVVGAWVLDSISEARMGDGTTSNITNSLKSYVNFEPQLLKYGIAAAKAHRPYDYVKPSVGFGSPVVGGEYTSYYKPEMTDDNYVPYVASEVAIHEMAHALSNYGYDVLGKALHDMDDWLSISGWVRKQDSTFDELIKSKAGTILDNGKLAPVSDYGCFNPAEDFAEAFMMYTINRKFLADYFKPKHDFIVSKLTAMGIDPNF